MQDDYLGPFTDFNGSIDLKLLQKLNSAVVQFSVISLNIGPLGAIPYKWTVRSIFDFIPGSGIATFQIALSKSLQPTANADYRGILALQSILLVVSIFSMILSLRSINRGVGNIFKVKKAVTRIPNGRLLERTGFESYEDLPFAAKIGENSLIVGFLFCFVFYPLCSPATCLVRVEFVRLSLALCVIGALAVLLFANHPARRLFNSQQLFSGNRHIYELLHNCSIL